MRQLGIALEALERKGASLKLRGNFMVFLELQWKAWGSSPVVMVTSANLSFCLREVKSPFELQEGVRDCPPDAAGENYSH